MHIYYKYVLDMTPALGCLNIKKCCPSLKCGMWVGDYGSIWYGTSVTDIQSYPHLPGY